MSASFWFIDDYSVNGASSPTNKLTAQLARSKLCNHEITVMLPSDRERAELRGPVKTIVDDWSTTVFDRDGKILEWRGNTSHGHSERTYSYDENGKLIRITGSNSDQLDEFRYDERGRITQIRHVPARPGRGSGAFGISVWFDAISEGDTLTEGGTVETSYNERGQPVETRIVDDEGMLLFRMVHLYDANGRLGEERLASENPSLPKAFRDQIPSEQRAAVLAQMKTEVESIGQQTGLFGNAERTYVYNGHGSVAERHMRVGPIREDLMWIFDDRGDMIELTRRTSGFPHELGGQPELQLKCRYSYEYDEQGNWMSRNETSEVGGNTRRHTQVRHLTYHS
jgi:YD repeat-containing protein